MGNCCWEPEVARSYRGGIGDTSPTQAAGSDRRRGRPPLPGHRVHWRPGEGALPARAPRGLVAVGETCWVSSRVFVCFPVRLGLTIQAGMWDEGRGSLLPLTFT